MSTDNNARKFYEGKKKACANSKFGLAYSLRHRCDHVEDTAAAWRPSAAEVELFGAPAKSSFATDLALFNSLFPDSTDAQRRQFIERARKARASGGNGNGGEEMVEANTSLATKLSVRDLKLEHHQTGSSGSGMGSVAGTLSGVAKHSDILQQVKTQQQQLHGGESASSMVLGEDELDLDPEVALWQHFTLDVMHREKTGPKKTLPVLIMKNEGGASSRRYAVNKSKRWGSGALIQLASEQEEDPIAGPSTYLEIYKGTQRRRLPEKERQRITDNLKLLAK